jgi:type IX secretion system PorP/SprF family membrane protein
MNQRRLSISVLFFMIATCAWAQDGTNFTQFFINPYSLNPSYAGIEGRKALFLTYRRQWANIEGGPAIANFSFHTPTMMGLNLGFNVINDSRGVLSNTGAMVTVGYTVSIDHDKFIRFGASVGGAWNTVNLDEIENPSDPALTNLLDKNTSLLGNVGLSLHLKSFHIGASLPNVFSPSYVSKDAFTVTEVKPFDAVIAHISNRFYFAGDKHVFEPYLVYRINQGLPSQWEAAGVLHLNHVLWLGGSYKQDFGISTLGGIKMSNFFLIGGSYSLKNSGINELNSPSYEIQLSYLFGAKKKNASIYSFVNTPKEKIKKGTHKSASELLAEKRRQEELNKKKQQDELAKKQREEAARKQQEALAKKQADEEARKQQLAAAEEQKRLQAQQTQQQVTQQQTTQPVTQPTTNPTQQQTSQPVTQQQTSQPVTQQQTSQPVTQQTQPEQQPTQQPVQQKPARHDGGPRLKTEMLSLDLPSYDTAHHEEQARINRLVEHQTDPDEHHGESLDFHPNAERHEFVKQGGHEQELDVADYVIAGVFKSDANAQHFVDGLKKLGFTASFGHLTEKALWYVYIAQASDINQARAERDRFRKMKIFRDAWLLTVHL